MEGAKRIMIFAQIDCVWRWVWGRMGKGGVGGGGGGICIADGTIEVEFNLSCVFLTSCSNYVTPKHSTGFQH